jgi:DNA-binding FrmR family transcriptional regulator
MNEEKKQALRALKISKGQIEGVMKMLEEERYCVDISNQIIAAQGLLKRANLLILKESINRCIEEAFLYDEGKEKVNEILNILEKLMDK